MEFFCIKEKKKVLIPEDKIKYVPSAKAYRLISNCPNDGCKLNRFTNKITAEKYPLDTKENEH